MMTKNSFEIIAHSMEKNCPQIFMNFIKLIMMFFSSLDFNGPVSFLTVPDLTAAFGTVGHSFLLG